MNISPSLLKMYRDNPCRYAIKLRMERKPQTETEAMSYGHYLERLLGIDGKDVSFKRNRDGSVKAKEQSLIYLSEKGKKLLEASKIVFEHTNVKLEYTTDAGFNLKGILDAIGTVDGEKAILDVKYCGMDLETYRSGWKDPDKIDRIQPRCYQYLYWIKLGELLPFYYLVFSDYGNGMFKMFRVAVSNHALNFFAEETLERYKEIKKEKFRPADNANICSKCHYRSVKKDGKTIFECPKQSYNFESIELY